MINKKAAIELSMTTVIVIVLSVVMLVLGLALIKTISCGAMKIASTTMEGAQDEINTLFGEEKGQEIGCMGTKQTFTIVADRYNVVGCGISPEVATTYNYEFKIESVTTIDGRDITTEAKKWITEKLSGSVTAGPGKITTATFSIRPPKDAPRAIVVVTPKFNNIDYNRMRFEARSLGWLRDNIC